MERPLPVSTYLRPRERSSEALPLEFKVSLGVTNDADDALQLSPSADVRALDCCVECPLPSAEPVAPTLASRSSPSITIRGRTSLTSLPLALLGTPLPPPKFCISHAFFFSSKSARAISAASNFALLLALRLLKPRATFPARTSLDPCVRSELALAFGIGTEFQAVTTCAPSPALLTPASSSLSWALTPLSLV